MCWSKNLETPWNDLISQKPGYVTTEIEKKFADSLFSFENFLKTKWVSEKEINKINNIIKHIWACSYIPELWEKLEKSWYDNDFIYSIIEPKLIEEYARKVDKDGTILSSYLINRIISSKDAHMISHVKSLLDKSDDKISHNWLNWLNIDEIKEILEMLINYYNNYINSWSEGDFFIDSYREYVNNLNLVRWSLLAAECFECSDNPRDYLEWRIKYYLSEYWKEQGCWEWSKKDYLYRIIFGGNEERGNRDWLLNIYRQKDSKYSKDLFLELKKYPEIYDIIISYLKIFEIDSQDKKYFFDEMMINTDGKEDLLERIKDSIDNFEWLIDSDYINLYLSLYPKRKIEILEWNPTSFIHECVSKIWSMDEHEFEDFVDLIKTTQYWTENISKICYNGLKSKWMRNYIMENYAMWYFPVISENLLFNDLYNSNLDDYKKTILICQYLPLFQPKNHIINNEWENSNQIYKIINKGNYPIDLDCIRTCYKLMENRETLKKWLRWRIS